MARTRRRPRFSCVGRGRVGTWGRFAFGRSAGRERTDVEASKEGRPILLAVLRRRGEPESRRFCEMGARRQMERMEAGRGARPRSWRGDAEAGKRGPMYSHFGAGDKGCWTCRCIASLCERVLERDARSRPASGGWVSAPTYRGECRVGARAAGELEQLQSLGAEKMSVSARW